MCAGSAESLPHVAALETSQKLPLTAVHMGLFRASISTGEMVRCSMRGTGSTGITGGPDFSPCLLSLVHQEQRQVRGRASLMPGSRMGDSALPVSQRLYPGIKDLSRLLHPLYPWSGRGTKPLGAATCSHIRRTGCAEAERE